MTVGTAGRTPALDAGAREATTSVISARSAALDAELSERDDRRDRTVSVPVAIATLIALPPTLPLAFFGVNATTVNPHRSAGRRSGSLLTPAAPAPAQRPPSGS